LRHCARRARIGILEASLWDRDARGEAIRILVVEDEQRIASFIQRGLEEEGYAVDVVHDGPEGLERACVGVYDLLVLDLMLPRLDGLELLKRLRAENHEIPVLVLTARDAVEDKVEGLDLGADDYLTKPFAFDEFLARIRALFRREAATRETELRAGDLSLDLVTRMAHVGEREIELSPREFSLLEYFLRNKNAVLSRMRISQHVWGYPYDGLSNVIDVYVNYLRRKLEAEGEAHVIHTVRGQGYVLKSPE
jgi:DNA-binding response OmpR family regulator